jgi:virginiamycin B lyase
MTSKLVAGVVPALLMAAAAAPLAVQEWTVPWEGTRPRDPYVAPNGLVWFVGQEGNYIANLDPKTGKFDRYEIDEGTHPHNLVVAPDGMVWYTGNRNGRLVKLDPKTRKLTNYMMPDPDKVGDPHTMVLDKGGNAWFTAQGAAVVGRRDAKTGKIRLWETGSGTRPYGIGLDDQQRPWYVLFGTNAIGTIDPATMKERRYELPEGARPRRIAVMKDGIWYGDYARGYLGRLDPATGKVAEFKLPAAGSSLPYAMAGDDKGRIWVAETGVSPNRLVAFDPAAGKFTEAVDTEGGDQPNTIRHMVFHQPTREIWYGTDRNTIGRLELP